MERSTVPLRADGAAGPPDVPAPKGSASEGQAADGILATLRNRLGSQKFNAWFRRGIRIEVEKEYARVAAANTFVANWVEAHFQADIAEAIESYTGRKAPIVVTIDPSLASEMRKRQLDSQADIVRRTVDGRTRGAATTPAAKLKYRLEDFVVGESNKLAYSAGLALCNGRAGSGPGFRLLFVHGSCGVGKTHLVQGICRAASRRSGKSRLRWRYVTGEQFTNDFVAALRSKRFDQFRARYRRLDLLAIDDVHFLAAKPAIQEEFLHTFDAIDAAGSRIVLASDAHPKLVGKLNEQLVSRFVSGMVVKIDPPDEATRLEILRRRASAMKLRAAPAVLPYIARHLRGSVRELEGTLIKLTALSALSGEAVDVTTASAALADHLARTDSAVTLGDIESAAAAFFGITAADIHSSRRTKTVSTARMVAMFLARRHTQISYPEIGRATGKNHSSVVLAVQRMEKVLATGGELAWQTPAGKRRMPAAKVVELISGQFS